jgi:copper homeostasis protein
MMGPLREPRAPAVPRAGITLEVCVNSAEEAVAAAGAGAGRIELCGHFVDGMRPCPEVIAAARTRLAIGLHVLLSPCGGSFVCSAAQMEAQERDLAEVKRLGADGVALGVLTPEGDIDLETTRRLIAAARPLSVTFHRAFDLTRDPLASLAALIDLQVDRVLTSGQEHSAVEGIPLLRRLVEEARGRIIVLAAGGIDAGNAERIVRETGVTEVHASCQRRRPTGVLPRDSRVPLGPAERNLVDGILAKRLPTDPERVRALVAALAGL